MKNKSSNTTQKKRIYILALGGTIASNAADTGGQFYHSSSIGIQELIHELKLDIDNYDIKYEQFLQKISHEITDAELITIALKVDELIQRTEIDGVVVVQGTNVMEEISYFINLVIQTEKPIVFTGALRPHGSLGYDGLRNLHNAIFLAGESKLCKLGVFLTINDSIVSSRDAIKINPSILDDFSNNGQALMGNIFGDSVHINRLANKRHTYCSEFDLNKIHKIPKVCIIYGHMGMDEIFIEAAISNNFDGIVSAGIGKGYQPKKVNEALQYAIEKGMHVVRCIRTNQGHVSIEENWEINKGFIAGGSLSSQKARILLLVALSKTRQKKELQRIFEEY